MPELLKNIQDLCNKVLQEDPESLAKTTALAGRIVALEIKGPDVTVFVQFNEHGVVLMPDIPGEPHVRISAGIRTWLGLAMNRSAVITRTTPDMSIQGDVTLAQDFQQVLKDLEIDWEEQLSHWIGDTAAHKLGRLFRDGRRYLAGAGKTLAMDVSEYLRYEKQMLPDNTEIDEFVQAVDQLRSDVDRFSQRVSQLQKQRWQSG